jgi:hypothetical protein
VDVEKLHFPGPQGVTSDSPLDLSGQNDLSPPAALPPSHAKRKFAQLTDFEKKAKYRSAAVRWEWAYQVLNMADAITTYQALKDPRLREGNPIFGKRPGPAVIFGGRAAFGILHYVVARIIRKDHPQMAANASFISTLVEGMATGINLGHILK